MSNNADQGTLFDRIMSRVKSKKGIALILFVCAVVIGLANVLGSIDNIAEFATKYKKLWHSFSTTKVNASGFLPFKISATVFGEGTKTVRSDKELYVDVVTENDYWDGKTRKEHERTLRADDNAVFVPGTIQFTEASATRVEAKEITLIESNQVLKFWARIYADRGQRGWWKGDIKVKQDSTVPFIKERVTKDSDITEPDKIVELLNLNLPDKTNTFKVDGTVDVEMENKPMKTLRLGEDSELELLDGAYKFRCWVEKGILYGEAVTSASH